MNEISGSIDDINKKIILPVGVLVDPSLLGKSYAISLSGTDVVLHLPHPSKKKAVGIESPLQPPGPYESSGLKNWDKDLEGAWLQWGTNMAIKHGIITSSKVDGIILSIDGPFNGPAQLDPILGTIDSKFVNWYRIFANWIELVTSQDLNQASTDVVMTDESLQEFWTGKIGENTVRAETTDSIKLTINLNSTPKNLSEPELLSAIIAANKSIDVSYENKILIDARRKMNRADYNGSCLYFGQYIEATARKRIREYFDSESIERKVTDEFLEKRSLSNLLNSCKRFDIDMGLSNKERERLEKLRNITAHAREIMVFQDAKDSWNIADKVYAKNSPKLEKA